MTTRGTSNTNSRGSADGRRRRKKWLLNKFGDGMTAPCAMRLSPKCLVNVDFDTLWVDRYPIAGRDGGRYVKGNIRPACRHCQELQGANMTNGVVSEPLPTPDPNWAYNTCCGKCVGGTCYVDQMTGA